MITDADIEKLKQVFATKEDLDRFATKDDLHEIKTEMQAMEKRMTKTIVSAIVETYETLGKHDEKIRPMLKEQRGQRVAIGDLESRVDRLEKLSSSA